MGIYSSSGKTANPLGTIGVLTGVIGASFSVILWYHYYVPGTTILGTYSVQITSGGDLGDQLRLLAGVFGLMGIICGIIGGLGGRGGSSTVAALLLGIVGVSFPVLAYLDVITRYAPNPIK
jgi:hypothetical protein